MHCPVAGTVNALGRAPAPREPTVHLEKAGQVDLPWQGAGWVLTRRGLGCLQKLVLPARVLEATERSVFRADNRISQGDKEHFKQKRKKEGSYKDMDIGIQGREVLGLAVPGRVEGRELRRPEEGGKCNI